MKKCRCHKCGNEIDLKNRFNIRVEAIEHGYKGYLDYKYYSHCPHCFNRQPLNLKDIPILTRWELFKEKFL